MISMKTLHEKLSKKLVFRKLNRSKANQLSKKRDRFRKNFQRSVVVPKHKLKSYVRMTITLDIGIILNEIDVNQMSFDRDKYPRLHLFWYDAEDVFD